MHRRRIKFHLAPFFKPHWGKSIFLNSSTITAHYFDNWFDDNFIPTVRAPRYHNLRLVYFYPIFQFGLFSRDVNITSNSWTKQGNMGLKSRAISNQELVIITILTDTRIPNISILPCLVGSSAVIFYLLNWKGHTKLKIAFIFHAATTYAVYVPTNCFIWMFLQDYLIFLESWSKFHSKNPVLH